MRNFKVQETGSTIQGHCGRMTERGGNQKFLGVKTEKIMNDRT
jgi:hypothetical protein